MILSLTYQLRKAAPSWYDNCLEKTLDPCFKGKLSFTKLKYSQPSHVEARLNMLRLHSLNVWSYMALLIFCNKGESVAFAWIFSVVYSPAQQFNHTSAQRINSQWSHESLNLLTLASSYELIFAPSLSILWGLCNKNCNRWRIQDTWSVIFKTTLLPRCLKDISLIHSPVSVTIK